MSDQTAPAPAEQPNRLGQLLLWLLLALSAFTVPRPPALELDASWRMTMGYAFARGLQWGHDLVFTYGPLGFVMAKTYWGQLFWEMIAWQALQAMLAAWLFTSEGRKLPPLSRFFFYAFAALFGVVYEDALEMIVIALLGWRLLRQLGDEDEPRSGWLYAALLALYGAVKFTNLLLAGVAVGVAVALALLRRAPRPAAITAATFAVATLAIWLLCGQNPLNLPAYLLASLEVSSGYNDAMSIPTPDAPFLSGLIVVGLLAVYLALYVATSARRTFAAANALLCALFLFLNWKHGFVRSDGHMIGFFICALLPITAFPALLADAPERRWLRRALLVPAGVFCVVGIEQALPSMARSIVGQLQDRLVARSQELTDWKNFRDGLRAKMHEQRLQHDLHFVRKEVGDASIDILGHEQAIALFNKFNYRPRPVFQSYSVYNAALARRNLDYYASPAAPAYVLLKLQTIDGRLATMDDPLLLNYFVHAYDYVLTDRDWQLWRRRADAPPAENVAPRRLRTSSVARGEWVELGELTDQPVWVTLDLRPSLVGRAAKLLYKLPLAYLIVEDTAGAVSRYRLPPDEGRAGFILSPIIENVAEYIAFSGGKPSRRVARFRVEVEQHSYLFQPQVGVGLFSLTSSTAAVRYAAQLERARLAALGAAPAALQSFVPVADGKIDDQPVLVAHAPSRIEYDLPAGAATLAGRFGYLAGAYEGDARTNGAEFRVVWTDGVSEHVLFRRYLDPRNTPADRGLQGFTVPLAAVKSGRVSLVIDAGPGGDNGWDWTAWAGIEIR
ncbi:MAG TPA: hypothetical protein VK163_16030 [Opitutaceae bacterium]|nr:hypothetical protein [Opitutaceae bacterium]